MISPGGIDHHLHRFARHRQAYIEGWVLGAIGSGLLVSWFPHVWWVWEATWLVPLGLASLAYRGYDPDEETDD